MGVPYETSGTDHFRPVCFLMTSSLLTSSLFKDGFHGSNGKQAGVRPDRVISSEMVLFYSRRFSICSVQCLMPVRGIFISI